MWNGNEKVFFIGICGISMSALAIILKKQGHIVEGSDSSPTDIMAKLENNGIKVYKSHDIGHIKDFDVVVYSSAISKDNPELIEAKKNRKKIFTRSKLLGEISKKYKTIAISGSHGKTTTTAMISGIFLQAGLDPSIHIGGNFRMIGGNVRIGKSDYFITEACEYCDNYLSLKPETIIILNVQPDHLDYFKNFENVKNSFKNFAKKTKKNLILNFDDENAQELFDCKNVKRLSYGIKANADIKALELLCDRRGCYSFVCEANKIKLGKVYLSVPGLHNVYNALAAIAVSLFYNINFETICAALNDFNGVDRRFELVGQINKAKVFHDYAHHPTEIETTIKTARLMFGGRLFVVFQPHMYSRTQALFSQFVDVLSKADVVLLYPIYPAREMPIDGVSSEVLCEAIRKKSGNGFSFYTFKDIYNFLNKNVSSNDLVLVMGAGDIVNFVKLL